MSNERKDDDKTIVDALGALGWIEEKEEDDTSKEIDDSLNAV